MASSRAHNQLHSSIDEVFADQVEEDVKEEERCVSVFNMS